MLRKMILYGGKLLLAGAIFLVMPSSGWAHGGGGGGHGGFGGHFGGGHIGGFGGGHIGGGFGGGHFGGTHFGGYHGGLYRGGRGYGYPHAYHHHYGWYGTYPYFGSYGYYPYSYYYPYAWSDPAYGSGYDDSYGADVPSNLYGDTSVTPPVASDPSLTPAAASRPDAVAHLTVNVPAGAQLWIEGGRTMSTGPVREFVSPPLAPGGRYSYHLQVSWDENGHKVTQTQKVKVTAGAHVAVQFPVPPETAEQTAVLKKG